MVVDEPRLQLHLEPEEPIEVSELTAALGSLAHQYQKFALENDLAKKPADARLLVTSVAPGSIDISLLPDLTTYLAAAGMLAPLIDKTELIVKFGKSLKSLFELFQKKKAGEPTAEITVRAAMMSQTFLGLSLHMAALKTSTQYTVVPFLTS